MTRAQAALLTALVLSLAIHASVMWSPAFLMLRPFPPQPPPVQVNFQVEPPAKPHVHPPRPAKANKKPPTAALALADSATTLATTPQSMAAPPPPSAEEWKLASTYTLKNGKRYQHAWGQQVRSMMGTAVAGPDQGQVRFRITINPNGTLAQVEELWSTSAKASDLARKAIQGMSPLPPTPSGKPLVFEKTISFLPYETGWPPSYKYDCLPDPPTFKNPFVWDGTSPQQPPPPEPEREARSPDCHPSDITGTFEEEAAELKRQIERNRWGR
jgi:TonB family protein